MEHAALIPRYTSTNLIFDPETHTSQLPDGRDVPHVTAVLQAVGVSTNFDDMASMYPRMRRAIRSARDLGSAVHADCHAFDDDDLDLNNVDHRVRPYVDAWIQFRTDKNVAPIAHGRERLVFHAVFNFAGILDGIFAREHDEGSGSFSPRVLIDIKTGDPYDAGARWQTAAYLIAWLSERPWDEHRYDRWAVWLRPKLRVPYRIVSYTQDALSHMRDQDEFEAFLTTYRCQIQRQRR